MKRTRGMRLLGAGYAKALRLFVDGPKSWLDIAEQLGIERCSAGYICRAFNRQGLTHIARWDLRDVGYRRQWTPVFAFGAGEDAKPPVSLRVSSKPTKPELLAFCSLVKALQEDSWHGLGLAGHLGQGTKAVRGTVKALHALRLARIDGFVERKDGGAGAPLFTFAVDERDAHKPRPMSKSDLTAKWNAIRSKRKAHTKLMRGLVLGVCTDKRRRAVNDESSREAA